MLSIAKRVSGALISVSRQVAELFVLRLVLRSGVEFVHFPPSVPMAPQPVKVQEPIRFGEDFELDLDARRLSRGNRVLKVERIPLDIMVLLIERWGETVPRDEIVARVWGKGAFLDTDNSIRGAIRKIRQVLKDDAEQPHFIQTITGEGYRFIAPLLGAQEEKGAAGPPGEEVRRVEAPMHVELEHRAGIPRARRGLVLAVAAGLALLAITYAIFWHRQTDATAPKIKSIAVLPMKNLSGDSAQEYLADGMTEEIIGRLSAIHDLRVISRTSAMQFKDSRLSVPEIAKALNVDALVEGSVIRDGDRVRVHAQLIRAATDEHFWSEEYDRELKDVLTLQSNMAEAIAEKVEVSITRQERALLVVARPVAPEVYESYVKAKSDPENTKVHIEQRIADFQETIRKDPTFAPAYVGLAGTYISYQDISIGAPPSEIRPKATAAARKAIELDPELAEAHAILAEMYQKQWKWLESEAEYKRALELNPNDASAHRGYAYWLACQGRTEQALAWVERGRELDPLGSTDTVGFLLLMGRRYDDAIREYRSVLAVHPDYTNVRWGLGFALIVKNQTDEAIAELEKTVAMMNRSPGSLAMLATAHARAGNRAEALRLIEELKQRRQKGYIPSGAFITPYLALGDYDEAFYWCEEAYKEQSAILQWIKVVPFFDPLRGDPRFTDLVHRVGLD
jgi:TolB-like protein/DNA-binding winged helix-turn-helix (wHTH) protein/Tfp pilus assembly protein PilF